MTQENLLLREDGYPHLPEREGTNLPKRDETKSTEQQGLFSKFIVSRTDGKDRVGCKHYGCDYFVLDVTHDQYAKSALSAYAASCASTHPKLSEDMQKRYSLSPHEVVAWIRDWDWEPISNSVKETKAHGFYSLYTIPLFSIPPDIEAIRKENEKLRKLLAPSRDSIDYHLLNNRSARRDSDYDLIAQIDVALKGGAV